MEVCYGIEASWVLLYGVVFGVVVVFGFMFVEFRDVGFKCGEIRF